jgi:MFS family permease
MSDPSARSWLALPMMMFALHVLLTQIITMSGRITTSYRAVELGTSALWIGLIGASFSLLPLILATSAGRGIDRRGARGAFILGGACLAAAGIGFLLIGTVVWGLILCSALLGLGHLLCMLSQHAFMAGTGGTEGMDRRFGHYTALVSLGQVIGPVFVALFGGSQSIPDTDRLFVFLAVTASVSLGASLLLRPDPPAPRRNGEISMPLKALLHLPGMIPAILAGVAAICAVDLLVVYLPVLGASAGIPAGVIAALLTLRALTSLGSRLFIGFFLTRFGRRLVLSLSLGLTGFGMAALGLPNAPFALFTAGTAAIGVGVGLAIPLSMSWISAIVPPQERGVALSLRLMGNRLAQLLLPAAVGLVIGASSLSLAFAALGAMVMGVAGHTWRKMQDS